MINSSSFTILIVDLIVNILGIILGILLILRARDNRLKITWGIMITICSLSMSIDNIRWVERFVQDTKLYERAELLIFPRMIKWYFFAHIISLFPIASLRPGWLTPLRVTFISLPLLFSSLICFCYMWFNGQITDIYSIQDIFNNLERTDVQVRLGYFAISVIVPTISFMIPFVNKWITLRRKSTIGMYIYISGAFISLFLYILFIINTSDLVFDIYAFWVTFFPTSFTIYYIFNQNPLSFPRSSNNIKPKSKEELEKEFELESIVSPLVYRLNNKIIEFVDSTYPFKNPDYTIKQFTSDLNTNQSLLIKTIQYKGFTGFSEYINFQRIEHFKKLAETSPGSSIKELMFQCGFSSRSSFYRRFADKEKMSPKEYIHKITNNN